jgi:hypothetical protein
MFRRSLLRSRVGIAVLVLAAALGGTTAAVAAANTPAKAKAPATTAAPWPTPAQFVANLDLECFRTSPYTPQLPAPLTLSHLNPVLAGQAPWTINQLGQRQQLCSPVAKNDVMPPPEVLDFVRYVDLSCYRISGPNINFPLTLSHLNPLLKDLPRREVTVMTPEQLCLPVIKNDSVPPDEVLRLVRFIDLVCYRETPQVPLGIKLRLTQLNPVLSSIPPTTVGVQANRQLCVPVRKNSQQIPDEVLKIVRWVDVEKFDIEAPAMQPIELRLRHINPLLQGLPAEPAVLLQRQQLALPMAKNGNNPPA